MSECLKLIRVSPCPNPCHPLYSTPPGTLLITSRHTRASERKCSVGNCKPLCQLLLTFAIDTYKGALFHLKVHCWKVASNELIQSVSNMACMNGIGLTRDKDQEINHQENATACVSSVWHLTGTMQSCSTAEMETKSHPVVLCKYMLAIRME